MRKKNTVAKLGKEVVTYGDSAEDNKRRVVATKPRRVAGDGPSARGPPTPLDPLLTTAETAAILRIPKNTLEKWRVFGSGPKFTKVGALVRYAPADIAAYLAEQTRRSTSEAPA
jgi:hypothetical protein